MSTGNRLRRVLEGARFPIEKFWDRDGNPIQAPPKGPPPGATGTTHADIGAEDPRTGTAVPVPAKKTRPTDPEGIPTVGGPR